MTGHAIVCWSRSPSQRPLGCSRSRYCGHICFRSPSRTRTLIFMLLGAGTILFPLMLLFTAINYTALYGKLRPRAAIISMRSEDRPTGLKWSQGRRNRATNEITTHAPKEPIAFASLLAERPGDVVVSMPASTPERLAYVFRTNASQNQQRHSRAQFAEALKVIAASRNTGAVP